MAVCTAPQRAANDIQNYMRVNGGCYRDWYLGIASNPRERLFHGHNVREHGDAWILRDCGTHTAARAVEDHFLAQGCDGGDGGGSIITRFVYAYRKTPHTRQ
jgi:hypothetical protein